MKTISFGQDQLPTYQYHTLSPVLWGNPGSDSLGLTSCQWQPKFCLSEFTTKNLQKNYYIEYVIYQGICGGEDKKLLLHLTCEHSLAVAATRGQFQASPLVGITGSYCSGFNHQLSFAAVSHWHLTGRLVCSIFNRTTIGFILLWTVMDGNMDIGDKQWVNTHTWLLILWLLADIILMFECHMIKKEASTIESSL